jgi:hypothetical protein
MKVFCQREYSARFYGEILKKRFGFYSWAFYMSIYEKPIVKGLSFTFFNALKKCNRYYRLCVDNSLPEWKFL